MAEDVVGLVKFAAIFFDHTIFLLKFWHGSNKLLELCRILEINYYSIFHLHAIIIMVIIYNK